MQGMQLPVPQPLDECIHRTRYTCKDSWSDMALVNMSVRIYFFDVEILFPCDLELAVVLSAGFCKTDCQLNTQHGKEKRARGENT